MTPCSTCQVFLGVAEHLLHHGTVEPVDEERKARHARALALFEPAQQPLLLGRIAQRGIDDLRGLLRPAHRQVHARGEHRIQEREGIADHHPALAAHATGVVGVVAGDPYFVANEFRVPQALPQAGVLLQRRQQEVERFALALLQVIRAADCADTHHAVGQRNHPHPAVLEAVDADIASVLARPRCRTPKVPEYRRALMLKVLAAQFLLEERNASRPLASTT